jgi:hypothetical protein
MYNNQTTSSDFIPLMQIPELDFQDMYGNQRAAKTNIKKDFFQAIGNALGAGNASTQQIAQNMNLYQEENVSCISYPVTADMNQK